MSRPLEDADSDPEAHNQESKFTKHSGSSSYSGDAEDQQGIVPSSA
jgi:hypothetical protein